MIMIIFRSKKHHIPGAEDLDGVSAGLVRFVVNLPLRLGSISIKVCGHQKCVSLLLLAQLISVSEI
jgi:hypothetical protein